MHSIKIPTLLLAAALVCGAQPATAANKAGKVVYAFGDVSAIRTDGSARELKRGDAFGPGDTVTTRRGRAQLRFTDGGFAALQPNTEYAIEEYNFAGEPDGNERSFLNLVRGSVRLVTGLIGRANKRNFRLRTPVATIGIRGTSGKVSHCDANCGALGPGTSLAGYGGEWDLSSGAYSGPVKQGQATFCNGSSCFDIPGFGQRRDVDPPADPLDEGQDEANETIADGTTESTFQQGQQAAPDGNPCDLGGCEDDNIVVALGQVGASALAEDSEFLDDGGQADAFDGLGVVLNNGVPVAGVVIDSTSEDFEDEVTALVTDVEALRQVFEDVGGEIGTAGIAIIDGLPESLTTALEANPATVGEGDFGLTSDGLLLKGRWQDGLILDFEGNLDGSIEELDLIELSDHQSVHFIFGADPGAIPTTGLAKYEFTGGTFSTALDGSSIGEGVTEGMLSMDFLLGEGEIDMTVLHAAMTYHVLGGLQLEFDKFFFSRDVTAFAGGGEYDVDIEGVFASPGEDAPLAAALSYVIEKDNPIIGAAGFGLSTFGASPIPLIEIIPGFVGASTSVGLNPFMVDNTGVTTFTLIQADGGSNGVVAINAFPDGGFFATLNSITLLEDNLSGVPGLASVTGAQAIIDGFPDRVILEDNPAQFTADGVTSDGILTYGRWMNGLFLHILGNTGAPAEAIYSLESFSGNQALHTINGTAPTIAEGTKLARYTFSGGTPSSAVDGSSTGLGVTDGQLQFDFLALQGGLDMVVNHAGTEYDVLGPLFGSGNFFFGDGVVASSGGSPVDVSVQGFFDTAGEFVPLAAGLAYTVQSSSPFQGVAGFALDSGSISPAVAAVQGIAMWAASSGHAFQSAFGAALGYSNIWFSAGHTVFDFASNPVSGIGAGDPTILPPGTFNVITPNIAASREAIPLLSDFSDVAEAQGIIDAVPATIADAVKDNPAILAEAGTTTDERLGFGRWEGGNLLVQQADTTAPSDAVYELVSLSGFQSEHFIGGAEPLSAPLSGVISYAFSGGTSSTSEDGATIGSGVVGGEISFDFGFQGGAADFQVDHDGILYDVFGPLFVSPTDNRFFASNPNGLTAYDGSTQYRGSLGGIFDSDDGAGIPLAVGISYALGLADSPVIGVAGFSSTGGPSADFVSSANPGDYVAFAHAFIDDSSMDLNSQAFDFLADGGSNTATTSGGIVDSLSSDFHAPLCSPSCDYSADRPGFVAVDQTGPEGSTRHIEFDADWARFAPHSITHSQTTDNGLGTAHVIIARNVTPIPDVPDFGSGLEGTYNLLQGGTAPTVIYETGGALQTEVEGTLDTAEVIVTFDTGDVSGNFAGSFPDGGSGGAWSMSGFSSTFDRADGVHSLNMSGTVTSANVTDPSTSMTTCAGGCTLFGHTHFGFVGPAADGVAGSLQGNTDTFSYPAFTVQNVYVLGGSIGPSGGGL